MVEWRLQASLLCGDIKVHRLCPAKDNVLVSHQGSPSTQNWMASLQNLSPAGRHKAEVEPDASTVKRLLGQDLAHVELQLADAGRPYNASPLQRMPKTW